MIFRKIVSKRRLLRLPGLLGIAFLVGLITLVHDPCINIFNYDLYCQVKRDWEIPADAKDLIFSEIGSGYWWGMRLTFKTSPAGLSNFTRHICDGVLHQGYDPYQAFNYGSYLGGQRFYLIKDTWNGFSYYSYSPDAPESVSGNRCQGELLIQIRVEQIESDLYDVRVDQGRHLWGNNCSLIPCRYIGNNFVQPILDLPFIVMGLDDDASNHFILVSNELCLEYQFSDYYYASFLSPYSALGFKYLWDARLNWTIDDQPQGIRFISPRHARLVRDANAPETAYYHKLDYCTTQNWTTGRHQMALEVLTATGQQDTYTWEFIVE